MTEAKTKARPATPARKNPGPQAVGGKAKAVLGRQAAALRGVRADNEGAVLQILAQLDAANEALAQLKAQARGKKAQATMAELEATLTGMVEGCSTQDLTGQRLERVARVLEGVADGRAVAAEDDPFGDRLLEGPQEAGDGLDQSAIDALFD